MSDLKLRWKQELMSFDLGMIPNGSDLEREEGLETAVAISLFSDRRADPVELPAGETGLRGWWGEEFLDDPSVPLGSKLWLLDREKRSESFRTRAIDYAEEALQWLIKDGIAKSVAVDCTFPADMAYLIDVVITRASGTNSAFRYSVTWQGTVTV